MPWWNPLVARRSRGAVGLCCLLLVALFGAGCSGNSGADASAQVASGGSVQTVGAPDAGSPPATTAPLVLPTPKPTLTAIPLPVATPEFGPTGRPSSAGEVQVLTTKVGIRRPTVYDRKDGKEISVSYEFLNGSVDSTYDWFVNPTYFGNPLAMMVLTGEPGDEWAEVQIPTRPIMKAWVRTEQFEWSSSDYYVQINIGNNTVKVWNGDEVIVDSTAVVTGDSGRETPLASTYVDEIMPGPSSAYGPWLMSLGVFSNAINTFGSAGGLPKVAMHGTNRPDLLGQYASNGCIRLPNDVISRLAAEVPVGTRVDIVSSA